MKGKRNALLTAVVLLLVTHRLPAPITEIPESPTPASTVAPNVPHGATMKGVDVNLPTGVSGNTCVGDYVCVSVDKDGHYFFDKDEVSDEELLNRLRKVHESAPEAKLFVRGDRDSVHLNVTHALDIIRSAGFYKISFEIKSEALKGVPGPAAPGQPAAQQPAAPGQPGVVGQPAAPGQPGPKGTDFPSTMAGATFTAATSDETMTVKGIRVNLPAAVEPPPSGVKDFVSVKVLEGNAVFFDNQYVADDQVLPRLFQLHRANRDIKISISAQPMAIYGDVIGVLDKVRSVGITKVGYQIRAASSVAPAGGAPPEDIPKFLRRLPIKAPGPMSMSRAKALALYAPRPQYPYEARSRHVTGSGVIIMQVDLASGNVTSCSVSSSTGSPILDNAATSAFRQWRFTPGTVSRVNIPITFTMTGASY